MRLALALLVVYGVIAPFVAEASSSATAGASLVARRCTVCHENPVNRPNRHSWIGWQAVMVRMQVMNGAEIPFAERIPIGAYLAEVRHPGWAVAAAEWSVAALGPVLVGIWSFWRRRR